MVCSFLFCLIFSLKDKEVKNGVIETSVKAKNKNKNGSADSVKAESKSIYERIKRRRTKASKITANVYTSACLHSHMHHS